MSDSLYNKLYSLPLLQKAWHLAKSDTRNDFIYDSFRYDDFAFNLEKNLEAISTALREERYHPTPLLYIDVPKSTLSVRPGSVTSIEDRIVLFAITMLIAPKLDKKLPDGVYSCRLKENFDNRSLFKDLEILRFPFLKRKTIYKHIEILEPWYGQWPKYIKEAKYAYEEEGYKYLTVSDVSAYFENINLRILRNNLLKYLPREQKIVNLLYSILKYWTWPTVHGYSVERGIPQGNGVSSFIGNIYLIPLDKEFEDFRKKRDIRYFRYMDDIKVFSKEEKVAREVIFVMNNVLRKLHLNIQGTKTMILYGEEIREELFDDRLDNVNRVIEKIQKKSKFLSKEERLEYLEILKSQYKKVKNKTKIIQGKELKLYIRLITGFSLINSSYMVDNLLKQLPKNPDERLIRKAVFYLKLFPLSTEKISKSLLNFLESSINLFPYQEARIVELLRYLKKISPESIYYARRILGLKSKHWYVKVQAALLLSCINMTQRSLEKLKKLYEKEKNIEVKRALVKCLCQLKREELVRFLRILVYEYDKKLSFLGKMLLSLLHNENNCAEKEINDVFRNFNENLILDEFYKIEVIKNCKKQNIRNLLLKRLKLIRRKVRKEHLKIKIDKIVKMLEIGA